MRSGTIRGDPVDGGTFDVGECHRRRIRERNIFSEPDTGKERIGTPRVAVVAAVKWMSLQGAGSVIVL
jgi:hypothetical protein